MRTDEIIEALGLVPHPEGGHYRETWREGSKPRGHGTAIYFLLREGERSHWHRVDAAEIWHFYAGAPLELAIALMEDSRGVIGVNIGNKYDLSAPLSKGLQCFRDRSRSQV